MINSNNILLAGNLTKEPNLKFTGNGTATVTFSIAVNRRWKSQLTGESTEVVSFFSVVAFGALAENAAETLDKGDRVVINGRCDQRSWVDEDGGHHERYEVVADEIATSLRYATASLTKVTRSAAKRSEVEKPAAAEELATSEDRANDLVAVAA
jgi:single-strand DNA-binding protein